MKHARTTTALTIAIFATSIGWAARAQDNQYYPNALLHDVYTKEQVEQKRKEALEEEAAYKKDKYEKEKARVEQEIESHRNQVESLKIQQARMKEEIETVNTDLAHVTDQLGSYQDEHKKLDENTKATQEYLTSVQENLKTTLKQLNDEVASLTQARKTAEKSIYDKSMDIERMKVEIAGAESKTAEYEAKRADLEAQEMRVRTEWTQLKILTANNLKQRDEAMSELNEAKKRQEAAVKDLNEARGELAKSEKVRTDTQHKAQSEISNYEKEIMDANRKRIASEAERIRLESETAKTLDYVSRIKENRDQTVDQSNDAQGVVMKSTLALQSARTELSETVSAADRKEFRKQRDESVSRGIAAAQEASELLGGGRIWVTKSKCKAYEHPKESAKPVGFFEAGNRLMGKDSGSAWIEITNGISSSVFVSSKCGSYEN